MSIRSRIVRGFGYGAKILSMLGLGDAAEVTQALSTGGGRLSWHAIAAQQQRDAINEDDEEIMFAIQAFIAMKRAA